MNCQVGDLAIVVRCDPVPQAIGHVVECLRFCGSRLVNDRLYEDVWLLRWGDNDARSLTGYEDWGCPDAWLRPLRDTDGTDEILALIGKPVGDEVAA